VSRHDAERGLRLSHPLSRSTCFIARVSLTHYALSRYLLSAQCLPASTDSLEPRVSTSHGQQGPASLVLAKVDCPVGSRTHGSATEKPPHASGLSAAVRMSSFSTSGPPCRVRYPRFRRRTRGVHGSCATLRRHLQQLYFVRNTLKEQGQEESSRARPRLDPRLKPRLGPWQVRSTEDAEYQLANLPDHLGSGLWTLDSGLGTRDLNVQWWSM
jgi:hypothetical protein